MKKTYTKPTLVRHPLLATITAVSGNGQLVVTSITRGET